MKTKTVIKFVTPLVVLGTIPTTMVLTSCSNSSGIIFANFESYMNPDVMDRIQGDTQNSCQFISFGTNEEVQSKFNRYYDVAIPSSYEVIPLMQKDELMPIDYALFPSLSSTLSSPYYGSDMLTSGLLTEATTKAIEAIDKWIKQNGGFPLDDPDLTPTILDYGVPYFLQDWIMAYEGAPISNYILPDDPTWAQIAHTMGNVDNSARPDIFNSTNQRKISIVDDNRSVYDMSSICYSDDDITPPDTKSIDDFMDIYNEFFDHFTIKNNFYFNTDSGQILQSLADNTVPNSAIAYNGDILYAAIGAGIYGTEDEPAWNHGTFHAVIPSKTMTAMDMVVINKKDRNNTTKLNKIYQAVDTAAINGMGATDISTEIGGSYKYSTMQNWDYIFYTSPIESIDEYVTNGSYFEDNISTDPDFCNDLRKIYTIDSTNFEGLIEMPISDLNKSNMHWAYNTIKMRL